MLKNVHLKNLALISEADIDYEKGLNIMTGETGSGKSIIISSINIALGGKANKGLIRYGADNGLVELTFISDNEEVFNTLKELDIDADGSNITITRKLTQDSSICKINGETVTLVNLKKLTSLLIDVHGQHDHQSLLNPANHIEILDRFGGDKIKDAKRDFKNIYDEYKSLRNEYKNFTMDEASLKNEISFLEFEHKEIEDAALVSGEDSTLEWEYKQLSLYEKLSDSLKKALVSLNDESKGVIAGIAKAQIEIRSAAALDSGNSSFKTFTSTLTDLDSISRDMAHDLEKYIDDHTFNAERYSKVKERLEVINKLKSKYGSSVDEILKFDEEISDKLKSYRQYAKNREVISAKLARLRSELNGAAGELSKQRMNTAVSLSSMITNNLTELNFLNVDFRIEFTKSDKIMENGYDRVEFLISLNPGESVKPLAKIASGGELSRIMLAIKSSLAEKDSIPTLIFDEIDTGISGKTAQMVAEKLRSLGTTHQIICITHLPQIAAMADTHFCIRKEVEDGATISGIQKLSKEQEIEEIARLLSGDHITQAALDNAISLKKHS